MTRAQGGDNVIQARVLTGTPGTLTPRSPDLSGPERAVDGSGVERSGSGCGEKRWKGGERWCARLLKDSGQLEPMYSLHGRGRRSSTGADRCGEHRRRLTHHVDSSLTQDFGSV